MPDSSQVLSDRESSLEFAIDQIAQTAVLDESGKLVSANDRFLRAFGSALDELRGQALVNLISPTFPVPMRDAVSQYLSRKTTWKGELQHLSKRGQAFWTEASIIPVSQGFRWIAFDITERKAVERSLAASRAFLRELMDYAPVGLLLADERGDCTYINEQWTIVSGMLLKDSLGTSWLSGVHPEDRDQVEKSWKQLTQTADPSQEPVASEFRYLLPDGQVRWVLATSIRVEGMQGERTRILRVEQNMTEKRLNEKLMQEHRAKMESAARLSSLGEMVASVAHEINNPLAIISARASRVRDKLEKGALDPEWLKTSVETIENTAFRIANIIKSMRSLSRNAEKDESKPETVKQVIDQALAICGARFRSQSIELIQDTFSHELLTQCRGPQISQLLIHLLNNSFYAVQGQEKAWVRLSVHDREERVEVWVTDSGNGIRTEIREKIFQPFFTTKPVNAGAGLGLSISRTIAQAHQGDLRIDEDCPNTRFILSLPKAATSSTVLIKSSAA